MCTVCVRVSVCGGDVFWFLVGVCDCLDWCVDSWGDDTRELLMTKVSWFQLYGSLCLQRRFESVWCLNNPFPSPFKVMTMVSWMLLRGLKPQGGEFGVVKVAWFLMRGHRPLWQCARNLLGIFWPLCFWKALWRDMSCWWVTVIYLNAGRPYSAYAKNIGGKEERESVCVCPHSLTAVQCCASTFA